MEKRVVITGVGIHTPFVLPSDEGVVLSYATEELDRAVQSIGMSDRLKRKLSPFTIHGLYACAQAMREGGLKEGMKMMSEAGIFVGNCLGGWGLAAPELQNLYRNGVEGMSPYVATAWFPAALQGQISLRYGIKGVSKTLSTQYVAGLQALASGWRAIKCQNLNISICGASEEIKPDCIKEILLNSRQKKHLRNIKCINKIDVLKYSEGAVFMILEELEHAKRRGATIYAEIIAVQNKFQAALRGIASARGEFKVEILAQKDQRRLEECKQTAPSVFANMLAVSGVAELAYAAVDMKAGEDPMKRHNQKSEAGCLSDIEIKGTQKGGNMCRIKIRQFRD